MDSLVKDIWQEILSFLDKGDKFMLIFVNLRLRALVGSEMIPSPLLFKNIMVLIMSGNRYNQFLFCFNDLGFNDLGRISIKSSQLMVHDHILVGWLSYVRRTGAVVETYTLITRILYDNYN